MLLILLLCSEVSKIVFIYYTIYNKIRELPLMNVYFFVLIVLYGIYIVYVLSTWLWARTVRGGYGPAISY